MPDIISLGEALIDLVSTETGVALANAPGFIRAAGGAPANVAVALARLGCSTGFIGKVGDDPFGDYLRQTLKDEGVNTTLMLPEESARTSLAFVSLKADGERDFVFYRNPGADTLLSEDDIDPAYIASCRAFHYGSISLISEPSRAATIKARRVAASSGSFISYDPNLRLSLWPDASSARSAIKREIAGTGLLKVSIEELEFITGEDNLEKAVTQLVDIGAGMVTVTLGARGCYYRTAALQGYVPGFSVNVVDATGAGDAFAAGVLAGLLPYIISGALSALGRDDYYRILRLANAVGALVTTRRGVIPSLPYRRDVEALALKKFTEDV